LPFGFGGFRILQNNKLSLLNVPVMPEQYVDAFVITSVQFCGEKKKKKKKKKKKIKLNLFFLKVLVWILIFPVILLWLWLQIPL
jgi:hypothetical protein